MARISRVLALAVALTFIFALTVNLRVPKEPAEIYKEADYVAHIEVAAEYVQFGIPEEYYLSGFVYPLNGKYYVITAGHIQPNNAPGAPVVEIQNIHLHFKGHPGKFSARILKTSETLDCAVLKIEPVDGAEFVFAGRLPILGRSDILEVGEPVYSLGSPLDMPFTFDDGIIRNFDVGLPVRTILHDAGIAPGSSGGPLVNKYGEIIGLNVAVHREFPSFCIAVSIDAIKEWLKEIEKDLE